MKYADDNILRLGTRGSLLARMQSLIVATDLERFHPGLSVELVICRTTGDQVQDRALSEIGGKGLFTKELEQALLHGDIDFAVHSFKDVPVTMPLVDQSDLIIAAVPARADARDVLVSKCVRRISDLPRGARVGTGSLRRRCQLLAKRPDLRIELIRGNIDTRIRKQSDGTFDAVILAAAGLKRTGLFIEDEMSLISPDEILPAAGQGALALQCRRDDRRTHYLLDVLNDSATACCVTMERAVVAALDGDCHSPIAAYAELSGRELILRTAVGSRGGEIPVINDEQRGGIEDANHLVAETIRALEALGAHPMLHGQVQEASHVHAA